MSFSVVPRAENSKYISINILIKMLTVMLADLIICIF